MTRTEVSNMRRRELLAGTASLVLIPSLARGDAFNSTPPPPPPVRKLQIVGTRGQVPVTTDGAGATNYTRFESQIVTTFGPVQFSGLRLAYFGSTVTQTGEVAPTGDFTTESAVLYTVPNGSLHVFPTFTSSVKVPNADAGSGYFLTDPLTFDFAPNTAANIRTAHLTASGLTVPVGQKLSTANDHGSDSTVGTSQTYSNSTFIVPAGGANVTPYIVGPSAILGVPTRNYSSVVILGDSIAYGQQETGTGDGNGNKGFIERGLWNVFSNGAPMPYANLSRQGATLLALQRASSPLHYGLIPYCSDVIVQRGTNDITGFAGGTTTAAALATMQASAIEAWTAAGGYGARVWHCPITPHTVDATNTAPFVANIPDAFLVGGLRQQFNAWVVTQIGTYLAGVIDVNSVLESQSTYGLWSNAAYTFEGLHLTSTGYAAGAVVVNAWAKGLAF